MRLFLKAIGCAASLALCAPHASAADTQHKICIGQFRLNCPSSPVDGYFKCGIKQEEAAQQVCTVYKDGKATTLGYSIIPVASSPAKPCDYDIFLVTCSPCEP
jgi:hypothetical protein